MSKPKVHELKCWTFFFNQVLDGSKTFEYRLNDRNFMAGDSLLLRQWHSEEERYLGPTLTVDVTSIYYDRDIPGLPDGYCIMQIRIPSESMR